MTTKTKLPFGLGLFCAILVYAAGYAICIRLLDLSGPAAFWTGAVCGIFAYIAQQAINDFVKFHNERTDP